MKMFIIYGMLTEEKFYDKAEKFALFTNTDGKHFTFEEYKDIIKETQTDKENKLIYLYATNKDEQYTYIESAKAKGYDVLLMDSQLDSHYINHLEQKFEESGFVRVDSDIIDKIIQKDEKNESKLTQIQKDDLVPVFSSKLKENPANFIVAFEDLLETESPIMITQNEFMRRMKDMSAMGGGGMNFYGDLPESYNLVVNSNHPLITKIMNSKDKSVGAKVQKVEDEKSPFNEEKIALEKLKEGKKEEEIDQIEKDKLTDVEKNIETLNGKKTELLEGFGQKNKLVKQLIDLALLSNNMLKGEDLNKFVKRSVDLIK